MKNRIILCFVLICAGAGAFGQGKKDKKIWNEAEAQTRILLNEARQGRSRQLVFPRTLVHDSLKLVASNDWTSGFFPGMMWMLYDHTGKEEWMQAATEYTALMNREPYNRGSHDVGFKVYNSYGQAYRMTGDTAYRRMIIQAARTLVSRFNPVVGCIRSWDFGKWQYPVIIDNMMNLELLFAATRLSGDSSFYRVAVSHANTTMKNHFRSDYSSYHVVDYDTTTGAVRSRGTYQGFADASSWARGQAWALYGYTMCYRETGDARYLSQAQNVAKYILTQTGKIQDGIPNWDYQATGTEPQPRDASAASVMASALYQLSKLAKMKDYRKAADRIMLSLITEYRAPAGTHHGFILLHSTGHKPVNSEVDVPLIYADYYFLEALLRRN